MTKEEFIAGYCQRSKIIEEQLNDLNLVALPCACGAEGCEGWAMILNHPDSIAIQMQFYAPD